MNPNIVGTILTSSIALMLLSSMLSMVRGWHALKAKQRLVEVVHSRLPYDLDLQMADPCIASEPMKPEQVQAALKAISATLPQLSETDRDLLEPGLLRNTTQGSEKFVREVFAPEAKEKAAACPLCARTKPAKVTTRRPP